MTKEYYLEHKEEISNKAAAYRVANLEDCRKRNAEYRKAHRKQLSDKQSKYNAAHRKEIAEYRAAHREETANRMAAYRATHKKELAEYRRTHTKERATYRAEHKAEIAWNNMHKRAGNRSGKYPSYTDVRICARWCGPKGRDNFVKDMGQPPKSTTLSRLADGPLYSKKTCAWHTWEQQWIERKKRLRKLVA
jgi:hypothetical protein